MLRAATISTTVADSNLAASLCLHACVRAPKRTCGSQLRSLHLCLTLAGPTALHLVPCPPPVSHFTYTTEPQTVHGHAGFPPYINGQKPCLPANCTTPADWQFRLAPVRSACAACSFPALLKCRVPVDP